MPTLKVRCPECDAAVRQTIDTVDEPTEFTIICPKCKSEFVAEATPEAAPKKVAKKPIKATRRRDDDDEEKEDTARKKKKKGASGTSPALLYGGIAAAVLVIGGIVAAVIAMSGSKDKEQAKADQPAKAEPQTPPQQPPVPKPKPKDQTPDPVIPVEPKPKDPEDQPHPKLPPPPKIRVSGSAAPVGKLDARVEKPPPFIPLTPQEDPFIRARTFAPDGPVPPLANLPAGNARPLLTLDPGGHSAFIRKVFITPAGDQVITVSQDKGVRIWDIQTGDAIHTIRLPAGIGKEGSLQAAALSPNGKRLVVGGQSLSSVRPGGIPIFVIDVETGALVRTISAARDVVSSLDFAPDGNRIAVGCMNGSVQLFNINTGAAAGVVDRAHGGPILEVRFNPKAESKSLATLGADGVVKLWDLGNSARNYTLDVSTLRPNSISWMSIGHALGVGGNSGEIVLFNVENGRSFKTIPRQILKGATAEINQMQFLKGDREIVCGGMAQGTGGWASVISAETGVPKVAFTGHTNTVMAVNVSADGTRAVTSGGNQHETFVWSTSDGQIVNRLCGIGNGVWGIGWARDGKSVAWGTDNKRNPDGHAALDYTFRFDDFGPAGVPDEAKYQQALTADKDYGAKRIGKSEIALSPTNGKAFLFELKDSEPIYSVTILPGQKLAVICGAESLVTVDPTNGKQVRKFVGHTGNIFTSAPSPDGRYFVTGSSDQTIRVWNPEFEEPLLSIFVAGRDWIAWTPQGYYACSPYGERLIAWQINTTAIKFPQIHPAARFRPAM